MDGVDVSLELAGRAGWIGIFNFEPQCGCFEKSREFAANYLDLTIILIGYVYDYDV